MAVAALTVSIIAALIALGSAVSQVILWRRSGPRVRCESSWAYPAYGADLRTEDPHIIVSAINVGRAPAQIVQAGLECADGRIIVNMRPAAWHGPPLPHTVDGNSAQDWYLSANEVRASLTRKGQLTERTLRPFVQLATGARVHGKSVDITGSRGDD